MNTTLIPRSKRPAFLRRKLEKDKLDCFARLVKFPVARKDTSGKAYVQVQ